ncbi:class F sortase [Streptomyces sp. NPDC058045]|uniref:class F sortase n=1 Tax=Streptomyces sp. NPDC058045 TaxID=3346311 RepID=UPI0036E755AE
MTTAETGTAAVPTLTAGPREHRPAPPASDPGTLAAAPGAVRRRLLVGVLGAGLLIGTWAWGSGGLDGQPGTSVPVTGDIAAAGRPRPALPPAHPPVAGGAPRALDVDALGIHTQVAAAPDPNAAPGPSARTGTAAVRWDRTGARPGAAGVTLLTSPGTPALSRLAELRAGRTVRVTDTAGAVATYTVEEVRAADRRGPTTATHPRHPGRAELHLITCPTPAPTTCHRPVVATAYLTGVHRPER